MKLFWLVFTVVEIGFAIGFFIKGDLPAARDFIILAFIGQILMNQAKEGER